MITPRKNCPRNDCRFTIESQQTTCLYNPVVGGPDPNTTTGRMACISCQKKWDFIQTYQSTNFMEHKKDAE